MTSIPLIYQGEPLKYDHCTPETLERFKPGTPVVNHYGKKFMGVVVEILIPEPVFTLQYGAGPKGAWVRWAPTYRVLVLGKRGGRIIETPHVALASERIDHFQKIVEDLQSDLDAIKVVYDLRMTGPKTGENA